MSFVTLVFLPLPRLAGVTRARYLLLGGEDTVKTGQVDSGPGNQSDQPGDKVQRFKYDMGGAVAPGCFQLVAHSAITGH